MDLEKLKAIAGAGGARMGGKGTMRRKKKVSHKTATTDDKRLQATLKRIGVNTIPGIEEVVIFQGEDAIQFVNPKVQASIAANTFVISGPSQTRSAGEMMSAGGLAQMQALMQQMGGQMDMAALQQLMAGMQAGKAGAAGEAQGDDDVPELVENFEETAAKEEAA